MKPQTLAIHSGLKCDPTSGSVVIPIHQTAGFQFANAKQASDRFLLEEEGPIYTRIGNPTTDQFEARMTALDGGIGAVAFSSGMAAITAAVMNICRAGDNFVTSRNLYGGVSNLFANILYDFGIEARFVDHDNPENFRKHIDDKTRFLYGEMLPNPRLNIFPIGEVAKIANEHGLPLMIDNTCATPVLCKPFEHGAHISIYSATKYISGHGNAIGGIVVDSGKFDWKKYSKRFPMLNKPDPSLHGIKWTEKFGAAAYTAKLRVTMLRDMGACLAPMNSFLFNQGLETLYLRMERHCENAAKVAAFFEKHPKVNFVRYPSLAGADRKKWADTYFKNGLYGPMIGIDVKGGVKAGQKFVESLKMVYHVANIGDVRSMAIHPASTTHSQIPQKEREKAGITDGFVRICIGIEHVDDIIADFSQSLDKI